MIRRYHRSQARERLIECECGRFLCFAIEHPYPMNAEFQQLAFEFARDQAPRIWQSRR